MLFDLGLKYITPVLQILFSYNRLHEVPKNEKEEISSKVQMLVSTQLMITGVVPFSLWAHLYHTAPKVYIYTWVCSAFIVGYFFMRVMKKRKILDVFMEEANKMTTEQHRACRKKLLPKFLLYYILYPFSVFLLCALIEYVDNYWL